MSDDVVDVLIIGAGETGTLAATHFAEQRRTPRRDHGVRYRNRLDKGLCIRVRRRCEQGKGVLMVLHDVNLALGYSVTKLETNNLVFDICMNELANEGTELDSAGAVMDKGVNCILTCGAAGFL